MNDTVVTLDGVKVEKRDAKITNPTLVQAISHLRKDASSEATTANVLIELNKATFLVPIDTSRMGIEKNEKGEFSVGDMGQLAFLTTTDSQGRTYIPACTDDEAVEVFAEGDRLSVMSFPAKDLWAFTLGFCNGIHNGVAINPCTGGDCLFLDKQRLVHLLNMTQQQ